MSLSTGDYLINNKLVKKKIIIIDYYISLTQYSGQPSPSVLLSVAKMTISAIHQANIVRDKTLLIEQQRKQGMEVFSLSLRAQVVAQDPTWNTQRRRPIIIWGMAYAYCAT